MSGWSGARLRIEQPEGWVRSDDPNGICFESPNGVALQLSPLDLPPPLVGRLTEEALAEWGGWSAQQMGLTFPTERRTGSCRLGHYATLVFENLNGGELPRAQLWFVSDGSNAFFVTLTGAATAEELARAQRTVDRLELAPIETS